MDRKIRIAFVTSTDPLDKKSWSGIHYRMFKALEKEFEDIIAVGPVLLPKYVKVLKHSFYFLHKILFWKKYNLNHNKFTSKLYGQAIKKRLNGYKVDLLFAPAASSEIAFLEVNIPIIYLSDTSFGQINNYYSLYSGFSNLSLRESELIESNAINKSFLQIYSSYWASEYVINRYNADPKNVFVVNFGANIDNPPKIEEINKDYSGTIRILFLGADWERKGGKIAMEAFKILIKRGFDIEFTVCGCTPPEKHDKMTIIKFLDKNSSQDYQKFKQLLLNTHLLFLPTRADCTPIVFSEANAYGIPIITTNTGGISSIVKNDINGYMLALDSSPTDYSDKIQELIENKKKFKELSVMSRFKYESELNWDIWGNKIKSIILSKFM